MDVPWWLWSAVLVLVEITDVAHIPTPVSLAVVTLILIVSVAASRAASQAATP